MTHATSDEAALFALALDKSPQERSAFLAHACRDNPQLRARVETLLLEYAAAGSFLETPAAAGTDDSDSPTGIYPQPGSPEDPGVWIGPYKLLQQIGEGGMGIVYMAEQERPVRRKVALKIIKAGMDSAQVVARFEAERQALALMDHPNIAKVLDAGTTDTGRPYFVMELVKGVPITRFCDKQRLSLRRRLQLFLPVCQAIQHAHQKGIIHRDLKPSNVLVALYDDQPVPKVIDFGVAKATGERLTDQTFFTAFGAILGTLEYMSPEQAKFNALDIDTRTDVYALGVILYELLTGTTPLTRKRLREVALDELLRIIREEEPPRPSTRLGTTEELPSDEADRGMEPKRLSRQLRGELDWIVMRALEKDRARRFDSAGGLARDIERYLRDEPVHACPPSAGYRLRKFVRRHRGPVIAVTVVAAALFAGAAAAIGGLVEARRQRDAAEANLRKAHQAVNDYLVLVGENTLLNQPALEPLRKQLLKAALGYYQDFAREHGDDASLRAELVATHLRIGLLIHDLGPEEDWLPSLQTCVALLEDLLRTNPDVSSFRSLREGVFRINTASQMHASQPREALRIFEKARLLWEELVRRDPAAPGFQNDLAFVHLAIGLLRPYSSPESAESLHSACDLWRTLSRTDPHTAHYRAALACTLSYTGLHQAAGGQMQRALETAREAVDTAKQLLADSPDVAGWRDLSSRIYEDVGQVMVQAGRLSEAEEAYRQMLAGQEALLQDYPTVTRYRYMVLRARKFVGELLWATGRRAEAAEQFRSARAVGESLRPEDRMAQRFLAWFLATCPDPQSEDLHRALGLASKLVHEAPQIGLHWTALGAVHYRLGDYPAAVGALENGSRPPSGRRSSPRLFLLAMAHWQLGEKEQARQYYDQGVAIANTELPQMGTHRLRAEAEQALGVGTPPK